MPRTVLRLDRSVKLKLQRMRRRTRDKGLANRCRIVLLAGRGCTRALEAMGGRVVPHFLPPYCPQHNRIERRWLDLHAHVTRNHNHATMAGLMRDVRAELRRQNRQHEQSQRSAA